MKSAEKHGPPGRAAYLAAVPTCVEVGLVLLAALLASWQPALAQQVAHLDCQGILGNTPATLSGNRTFLQTNASGDGQVSFSGVVAAGGATGQIAYEGTTGSWRVGGGPMNGVLKSQVGTQAIGVLDNTGGQMIIYSGRATLGPPDIIGRFRCAWH
jgi:hypothetical protein